MPPGPRRPGTRRHDHRPRHHRAGDGGGEELAHDSIQHAAGRMRAFDLGCLLVRDDQELVGMITDRDITVRVTAAGKNPRMTRSSTPPDGCGPSTSDASWSATTRNSSA